MKSITDLYTDSACNTPTRLPLEDLQGNPSDHWLGIVGAETRDSRVWTSIMQRDFLKVSGDDDAQVSERYDIVTAFLAKHVKEWSFSDEECTLEAVVDALTKAPQLRTSVEQTIYHTSLFLKGSSD